MSNQATREEVTREVLLRTHLPQASDRVSDELAVSMVQQVRRTPGNSGTMCDGVQHYLLYDRVVLCKLSEIGPEVFQCIESSWRQSHPKRCPCTVKAMSGSSVEVMCPVNTAAAIATALKDEVSLLGDQHGSATLGQQLIRLVITSITLWGLVHHVTRNFTQPYTDWIHSPSSGMVGYVVWPLVVLR